MAVNTDTQQHLEKRASRAALASLLNLTVLPVLGFVALLLIYKKARPGDIDHYYAVVGIRINLIAAVTLFVVSAVMIALGGLNSPWTWVYVITYFTFVHTVFIMLATWALVRSWSGEPLQQAWLKRFLDPR